MAFPATNVLGNATVKRGPFRQAIEDFLAATKQVPLFQNPVLNPAFMIAQRGTSFSNPASAATTLDCWGTDDSGGASTTYSQQTAGPTGIRHALRCQRTAASSNTAVRRITQVLETLQSIPLVGAQITLSFYARKGADFSASDGSITSRITTGTGTDQSLSAVLGGTWTGQANADKTTHLLTTSFTRFTHTVTLSGSLTQLAFGFRFTPSGTAGTNDWFEVTGVQIDVRDTPSDFAPRVFEQDLMRCQRRYTKSFAYATVPAQNTGNNSGPFRHIGGSGGRVAYTWRFPVTMRVTPSFVTYNPAAANANFRNVTDSTESAVTSTADATTDGVTIVGTSNAANAGDDITIHADATADL